MKDLLDDIDRWRAGGHRIAVARVVGTEGSGPREAGATMAVNDAGEGAGSGSGGRVGGAVVTGGVSGLAGRLGVPGLDRVGGGHPRPRPKAALTGPRH